MRIRSSSSKVMQQTPTGSAKLSIPSDKVDVSKKNIGTKRKLTRRRRNNAGMGSRALFRDGLIVSRCECIKFRKKEKGKNRKRKIRTYDKIDTIRGTSVPNNVDTGTKRHKKNEKGEEYKKSNGDTSIKESTITPGRPSVIENTVTTAHITDELDLKQCSILLAGGYKPPVFAALAVLLDFATVSLFTNGQTVVTGANGRMDALAAYRCIVLMLMSHRDRGIRNTFYLETCKTCNIVHSGKVGHGIDLAKMERNKITGITCEKSKFPGLRWELPGGCVLVVFPSGSYQVAGSRDVDMVMRLDKLVRKTLAKYRIEDPDESDRQRKVDEA